MEQLVKNVLMKRPSRYSKCLTIESQKKKSPIQRLFKKTSKNHKKFSQSNDSRTSQKYQHDLMVKTTKYSQIFKLLQQKNHKEIKEMLTLRGHDCEIIAELLRKLFQYLTEENRSAKLNKFVIQEKNNQIKSLKNQILQYHKLIQKKNENIKNLKCQRRVQTLKNECDSYDQKLSKNERLVQIDDSDHKFYKNNNDNFQQSNLKNNKVKINFSVNKNLLLQSLQLNHNSDCSYKGLERIQNIQKNQHFYRQTCQDYKSKHRNDSICKLQRKSHFMSQFDVSNLKFKQYPKGKSINLQSRMRMTQNSNQFISDQQQDKNKNLSTFSEQQNNQSQQIQISDILKPIDQNQSQNENKKIIFQGNKNKSDIKKKSKNQNKIQNLVKPLKLRVSHQERQQKNNYENQKYNISNISQSSMSMCMTKNNQKFNSFSSASIFKKNNKLF